MSKTTGIIRKSIFAFLRNYGYYIFAPTLLAFPYASAYLIAQSLIPSSRLFPPIHDRLISLFLSAGFPPSSRLFSILTVKLSQTLLTSLLVSPFAFSFLLLAKASVIVKSLHPRKKNTEFTFTAWKEKAILRPILVTQFCSSLVILSANAACYFFLTVFFKFLDFLSLPSLAGVVGGLVVYSIVVANSYVLCNLALVLSGVEGECGFVSIAKACVAVRGRTGIGLWLAVVANVCFAAIEALFEYRVMRAYYGEVSGRNSGLLVMEGVFVSCLYAVFVVLDTIIACEFLRWCKKGEEIIP
ncbi:L-arabinose transport system permease protein AraP [Striga asiatica]|uniref:L-arabinose transport system permease protein AraP n=1 Tax=Striga asiatica TaxID=4170 RepID=A0A5A7R5Q8_STRAF|nr:L-arabinose transport system permease protein AraP [Striga asiatica]